MNVCTYNQTLVKSQDLGLYSGDIAIIPDTLNGHPQLNWSGSIIDIDQFRIALAFLKWTHDAHKVEGQIRLFYNEFTRKWKTVALPQYIWSAGHTREVEEDDPVKSAIIEAALNSGFGQAGTGHHHSNMNAFQSGGDKEDELGQNGFHFTVGRMDSPVADFHCRATFRKINYDPSQGMINPNQWLPGLHNGLIKDKEIAALWLDLTRLPPFPEEWKTYLRKKPEPVVTEWTGYGFGAHRTWNGNFTVTPAVPVIPSTGPSTRVELFRDGHFCITSKPNTGYEGLRMSISPKANSVKPEAVPAPADPNYETLVSRVTAMTEEQYADFCKKLQESRQAALKTQSVSARQQVIERLEELLAEFRDATVSDKMTKDNLETLFNAIHDMSNDFIVAIERVAYEYLQDLPPFITEAGLTDTLVQWGALMFDRLLSQVETSAEWEAVGDLCESIDPRSITTPVSFYDLMVNGLTAGMALETIDARYNRDGTAQDSGARPA